MMTATKPEPMLWLDSNRGQYIPQAFTQSFKDHAKHVFAVSSRDWELLRDGPTAEGYWEAWEAVLNDCFIVDEKGQKWTVYQDGDCWLIPAGMQWDDKSEWFTWEQV